MMQAGTRAHAVAVREAIACGTTGCLECVRAGFVPLFVDPVLFSRHGVSGAAALLASRYVAAYITAASERASCPCS